MNKSFYATAAKTIYNAYPGNDLLPLERPKGAETLEAIVRRPDNYGGNADTLFLFLCREASGVENAEEYCDRLDRAILDIQAVRDAFTKKGNKP